LRLKRKRLHIVVRAPAMNDGLHEVGAQIDVDVTSLGAGETATAAAKTGTINLGFPPIALLRSRMRRRCPDRD